MKCQEEIRENEDMTDLLLQNYVTGQVSLLDSVWYLSDTLKLKELKGGEFKKWV